MSEREHLLYAYLQPLGEEAPGMEAGAALGFSLPSGQGEALLARGLSLLAPRESTRWRCIPAWPRCQLSPLSDWPLSALAHSDTSG